MFQLDTDLLLFINEHYTAFLDVFFWNISQRLTWVALYVALAVCAFYRYGWRGLYVIGAVALAVLLADQCSSALLKPWVARPRPTHEPDLEGLLHIVNDYRGGMFGFPSSHAANTFAVALVYSLIWNNRRQTLPLMLWVALNCYSRMYLAVHYPLDILAGLLVGAVVAIVIYALVRKLDLPKQKADSSPWYIDYLPAIIIMLTIAACCFL